MIVLCLVNHFCCSNKVFSAPGITPTLELIRQCFGPTRAGGTTQFSLICYIKLLVLRSQCSAATVSFTVSRNTLCISFMEHWK